MIKRIKVCEVCDNTELYQVLDLGKHPLCDDLIPVSESIENTTYPIEILFCKSCKTAHQKFQVLKNVLFPQHYHYRSRFTNDVLNGMQSLSTEVASNYSCMEGKKVLDIGCNDGSLLNFFKDYGATTIGVEPTSAFNDIDLSKHSCYNEYFDLKTSKKILSDFGKVDIITFTNVFAHIDDLNELIAALKVFMDENTLIVIENHYLGSVIERNQFDTFYHEHPRTYSLNSFIKIAEKLGRKIIKANFPKRYGGNIQVFIGKGETEEINFKDILKSENDFYYSFQKMNDHINNWIINKNKELAKIFKIQGKIKAKAFPGRAAILIKLLNLDEDMIEAVYEKPGSIKIGNFVPGTKIQIKSDDELFETIKSDKYIINFAWHINKEIEDYLRLKGFKGKLVAIH